VRDNQIRAVAVSWDNRVIAGGCQDGSVRLWDIPSGRELVPVVGHQFPVVAVAFGSGPTQLTSVDSGGFGCVWDVGKPAEPVAGVDCKRKDAKELWSLLFGHAPDIAARARSVMASRPAETLSFLKARLRPAHAFSVNRTRTLIGQLRYATDASSGEVTDELVSLGECAEMELKAILAGGSLFARASDTERWTKGLEAVRNSEACKNRVRELESVDVLREIAGPEAVALLGELAKGEGKARLTQRARVAIGKIEKRPRH
jgi:WD40 repeat protein